MLVQVLVDTPSSWIVPYAKRLVEEISKKEHFEATFLSEHSQVQKGEVLCLLSCEQIFKDLSLNNYNLVVHESDLPKGKGWSPLTWQILEGENEIPITLFEAAESVDSGVIYYQDKIKLEGHELIDEIKEKQGEATIRLIHSFLNSMDTIKGTEQSGEESFYPKRGPKDSELDIHKSIDEQFNLLRVCDNERYPSYFFKDGKKYTIKIYKED